MEWEGKGFEWLEKEAIVVLVLENHEIKVWKVSVDEEDVWSLMQLIQEEEDKCLIFPLGSFEWEKEKGGFFFVYLFIYHIKRKGKEKKERNLNWEWSMLCIFKVILALINLLNSFVLNY